MRWLLPLLLLLHAAKAQAVELQEHTMNPEVPQDAEVLEVIARPIPEAFASYPVVGMRRTTTVTIDDWAVVEKGKGGGGRPAWVREWHAIDLIQHPTGMDHTNLAFGYPAGRGSVIVPERRRIRTDGTYVRTTVHELTDTVVGSSARKAHYGAYRQKKLTLKDVEVGDFTEVKTRSESHKKMAHAGYGETYGFGALPTLEERICYQHSDRVPFRWLLEDPDGTVEVVEDTVEQDGATLQRVCFGRGPQPPEIVEADAPTRSYRTPLLRVTTWEDWDGFARWMHDKYMDRLEPDEAIRAKVEEITAGLEGEATQRAVFHWVAENIHYVQVYLVIDSGHVPAEAGEVFQRRYGDCKEQTALLIAMLDVLGVRALPTLIATGDELQARLDFPMMYQFNHMITYLPDQDLFLDPVGDDTPYPYLLPMDQDRNVLILDGNKAIPGRTPWMPPEAARRSKQRRIEPLLEGASEGLLEIRYDSVFEQTGRKAAQWHRKRSYSQERLDDYMARTWIDDGILESYSLDHPLDDFGQPVVVRFVHRETADDVAWAEGPLPEVIMLGDLLGIPENTRFYTFPDRHYPFQWLEYPQVLDERHEIVIPQGYHLLWLPQDVSYEHPGGIFSYQATYEQPEDGLLQVTEHIAVAKPVLEADEFLALRPVILDLSRQVENRLVLVPDGGAPEDETPGTP